MKKSLGANTFVGPVPTWIIGTYDKDGKPNIMAAAWVGVCCSSPACVSVSLRKATYTHGNIMEKKCFTVSIPSKKHVKEADYVGTVSGRNTDKFAKTGLTPVRSDAVDAPYVGEFPLVIECRLKEVHELGLHSQFIGQIVDVKADESILNKGRIDPEKLDAFFYDPSNQEYVGTGKLLSEAFKRK